jgi:hypothetical protein
MDFDQRPKRGGLLRSFHKQYLEMRSFLIQKNVGKDLRSNASVLFSNTVGYGGLCEYKVVLWDGYHFKRRYIAVYNRHICWSRLDYKSSKCFIASQRTRNQSNLFIYFPVVIFRTILKKRERCTNFLMEIFESCHLYQSIN